jgi:hypothetical protein
MFLKPYEMEVTERPYHIFWHGVFLRSYADKEEFDKNLLWYKSFLLCILLILLALNIYPNGYFCYSYVSLL